MPDVPEWHDLDREPEDEPEDDRRQRPQRVDWNALHRKQQSFFLRLIGVILPADPTAPVWYINPDGDE